MRENDIILVPYSGWSWVCPICKNPNDYTNIVSDDIERVKEF